MASFSTSGSGAAGGGAAGELDCGRVLAWLRATCPGAADGAEALHARKFAHGQSNPTFLLSLRGARGRELRKLVLRKQPQGELLPRAHAVDREHRAQAALSRGSDVPVARQLAYCADREVAGAPFYVMEHVDGTVFLDRNLPSLAPEQRGAVYASLARCLASIHSADVEAMGMVDYGRADAYCARTLATWKRQYLRDWGSDPMPEMVRLAAWLERNAPPGASARMPKPALIHGDYRLDNVIFGLGARGSAPEALAVLDWELSTLGDPMADLAYLCMTLYHAPPGEVPQPGRARLAPPEGAPAEAELVAQYCRLRGVAAPDERAWTYYLALACYRMAAICAGVHARSKRGNASAANAEMVGLAGKAYAAYALGLIDSVPPRKWYQSERSAALLARVKAFMDEHVYPAEKEFMAEDAARVGEARWRPFPLMEELKAKARAAGLWNLFMPSDTRDLIAPSIREAVDCGPGLTNLEYAPLSEAMGACPFAPEVFNCSAPDTGNMETLARYGTHEQQEHWLRPLLEGKIRSCFAMTEPAVASSDATNMQAVCAHDAATDQLVLSGRKWWASGALDPRCKLAIFMGREADAEGDAARGKAAREPHRRHSMVLVPLPHPRVKMLRPMTVFGYDDAPHGHAEVVFDEVRVPADSVLLGRGRGFEIAQGRLGPGRLHHCMRVVGLGERSLAMLIERGAQRKAFGRSLLALSADKIADARVQLDMARMVVLSAAAELDQHGNKRARGPLAIAKVAAPRAAISAIDAAIQVFGGCGVSQDAHLAYFYAGARTLRLADGPDEVHLQTIAKVEAAKHKARL